MAGLGTPRYQSLTSWTILGFHHHANHWLHLCCTNFRTHLTCSSLPHPAVCLMRSRLSPGKMLPMTSPCMVMSVWVMLWSLTMPIWCLHGNTRICVTLQGDSSGNIFSALGLGVFWTCSWQNSKSSTSLNLEQERCCQAFMATTRFTSPYRQMPLATSSPGLLWACSSAVLGCSGRAALQC